MVHWWYTDAGGVGHWGPGHFVVLTGMGETAGKTWLRFKDDKRQDYVNPDSLRHGSSDLVLKDGYYYVPGLNRRVNEPPGSSNWYDGKAIVTGAVAESPDASVTPPSGSESYEHSASRSSVPFPRKEASRSLIPATEIAATTRSCMSSIARTLLRRRKLLALGISIAGEACLQQPL